MKVAFFSTQPYDRVYFNRHAGHHEITYFETPLNKDTAHLAAGYEVVCAFVNDKLRSDVIPILVAGGMRLIALRCAGFNQVNLTTAAEYQVPVVRVPAYSPFAVAEHAVALLMALNRKTHKAYNRVREGNFSLDRLTGFDVHGKTVGVVGTGKIGEAFCRIMLGFGCRVLAFDLVASQPLMAAGVEYLPLTDVLAQSDIVSLHCPLNEHTQHLINADTLALMQEGAMLINTSRGGLIDTKAAIEALKSGRLGYLGIDVYEQEEKLFFFDRSDEIIYDDQILRLMSFPNVLVTAHQAFFTEEALTEIARTTISNITAFEQGKLQNQVVAG